MEMTPLTPEELDDLQLKAEGARFVPAETLAYRDYLTAANPATLLRLLAQVREAEARWEALKAYSQVYVDEPYLHEVTQIYREAHEQLQTEMARLERESPATEGQ